MSMFQELDYTGDIQKVRGVQFSVMSPDEIRRRSVAEIYTNETFDGDTPKVGGIFDPRMGVLDHGKKCPTDELDNRHCPGYFGHIELAKPVFHIHFLKYIIKTMQSVCPKCSKLYYDVNSPEIRKIINFLGLSWEENCLEPHKNERHVLTASNQQVKKKIYSGSSDEWKKYESGLRGYFSDL